MNLDNGCIDIKKKFGQIFKIAKDPAMANSRNPDPMYWIIPCKHGEIYPYGGDYLAVMVTAPRIAKKMRGWPELEITQDAEDAAVFIFRAKHMEKVAAKVCAKKKYRISESERKRRSKRARVNLKTKVNSRNFGALSGQKTARSV